MKKLILCGVLALSMLGVQSCRKDDNGGGDTPTPPPTPTLTSKVTYDGQDYQLDTTAAQVTGNQEGQVVGFTIQDANGNDITATRWIISSWNGDLDNIQNSENYAETIVYVPVDGQDIVHPQDAQTIYGAGFGLFAGNATEPVDLGDISAVTLNIESAAYPEQGSEAPGTIKYTASVEAAKPVEVSFNGDFYGPYIYKLPAEEGGSRRAPKSIDRTVVNLKDLKLAK
ncbi:MAG: hypothetical protein CSA38_04520 [Flavobacteriales bacterium]|nr:MAG: hypothetical protein CSA38_04520 [Flavobacteriales bacterium]